MYFVFHYKVLKPLLCINGINFAFPGQLPVDHWFRLDHKILCRPRSRDDLISFTVSLIKASTRGYSLTDLQNVICFTPPGI